MRPSSPTPQGLQSVRHPSKFYPRKERIRGTIQVYRMIFNQWTKWNNRSFKWLPKTSFIGRLPIRQSVLNSSQIAVKFYGIRPPIFVQSQLQQYRRCPFFNSPYCSLSNHICFWTMRGWRAMIAREIFTSLASIHRVVSVNDFCLPGRL